MLRLLLDEHISAAVAAGLRRKHPAISAICLVEWESGGFLGRSDSECLQEAAAQHLTLVTYDRGTLPPLLKTWAEENRRHGGVIFVDEKSIPPSDVGTLARALSKLWRERAKWDWTDRVCFLQK